MQTETSFFDYVFCWQTLSFLEEPQKALMELIRITKANGKIYLSSLFNLDHNVDLYTKVYDHTRESSKNGFAMTYNTFSAYTIEKWIKNKVEKFTIHKFIIDIDIFPPPLGIGTYTKKLENVNERLQISGGMLMNWGILEISI